MIKCGICGKEINVIKEEYRAEGSDALLRVYCLECSYKEFMRMQEPDNKLGKEKFIDQNLMDACEVAKELMDKGLQPGLAIWKAAQASGYETAEIARELGGRRKKK